MRRKITTRRHRGHAEQVECPYLLKDDRMGRHGVNTCHISCWDEPSCITDGPFRPTGVLWDRKFLTGDNAARWR